MWPQCLRRQTRTAARVISLFRVASARITTDAETGFVDPVYIIAQTSAPLASSFAVMTLVYKLFRVNRGAPRAGVVAAFAGALVLVGLALLSLGIYMQEQRIGDWQSLARKARAVDGTAVWFFRFGSCFVEDGFYMFLLLVCKGCAACSSLAVRFLGLGATSITVFVFCTAYDLLGTDVLSSQLLYPAVVTGVSKVSGHVLIPLYALTASATKWGVSARTHRTNVSCPESDPSVSRTATRTASNKRRDGP